VRSGRGNPVSSNTEENALSKREELAYRSGRMPTDAAGLSALLARLKGDLEQYMARHPDGPLIGPLRERIRQLTADLNARKTEDARRAAGEPRDGEAEGEGSYRRGGSATGRFPPRRRPGT
jgi:hypothetical protein